jgi:Spy/CpxP family protein refolding chaperone
MKKNLVILFLAVLTIVNIAALATIAYHRFQPKRPFPPMGQTDTPGSFIKRELDLNEEQAKEFESQDKRFREATKPILDLLEAKRKDLMEEVAAEEPNRDKLDRLTEEIGTLQMTLEKNITMHLLQTKSLLTPDQQKKFFSLFKEGRDRMRMKGDRGKGIERGLRYPNFKEGE